MYIHDIREVSIFRVPSVFFLVAAPNLSGQSAPRFLNQSKDRADALLFVECKGPMEAKTASASLVPKLNLNPTR